MKILLKISMLTALLAMAIPHLQAQKFGHINSGNVIAMMPETVKSDSLLKLYRDSLVNIGNQKADSLRSEFNAFMEIYNQGTVTPMKAQQKQAEFQQKEQELIQYEEEITNLVALRRQELLEPIVNRVGKAIEEVGKEGEYTMIFDTSIFNAILFAKDADDVTELVLAKLEIQ